MRTALLVATFLLATFPVPLAQAAGQSVWVEVQVGLDGTVRELHHVNYTGTSAVRWPFTVPVGATFVDAFDALGRLSVTQSGQSLEIKSGPRPFTIELERALEADGPLWSTEVSVTVWDGFDSSSSSILLPTGWTVVGERVSEGATSDGGFTSAAGPHVGTFLLLPSGLPDAGPDPRASGDTAIRDALVTVGAASASMALEVVYDTDVYSAAWTFSLPEGSTFRSVSTPWGPVQATSTATSATFTLPYRAGFGLGGRPFTVLLDLAPPGAHGGGFRTLEASVPAAAKDKVSVAFELPAGAVATGIRANSATVVDGTTARATGPIAATLGYLPPQPPGTTRFTQGPFVVEAPAALDLAARAVVRNATELLPTAAAIVGGASVTSPFYVVYTHEDVFDWEAGFYSPGLNTISIRADSLQNSTDGRARLQAVSVLVHETVHGLLDRLVDGGPSDLSFFQEGLARLAEAHVELAFPDEVMECTTNGGRQSCVRHSSRPDPATAQDFLEGGTPFDPQWMARDAPEDQRGFLYDYSGMIFHNFERRAGQAALVQALNDIAAVPGDDDPAAAGRWLVDAMLLAAPALSREALLYPGLEAATLTATDFRGCMGALLAPGFPFDPAPTLPGAGCPAPTAPTEGERAGLTRPVVVPPTEDEPVVSTPVIVIPSPAPPVSSTPPGEVPAGVVEPSTGIQIPAPPLFLLVAAVIAAIAIRGRARAP